MVPLASWQESMSINLLLFREEWQRDSAGPGYNHLEHNYHDCLWATLVCFLHIVSQNTINRHNHWSGMRSFTIQTAAPQICLTSMTWAWDKAGTFWFVWSHLCPGHYISPCPLIHNAGIYLSGCWPRYLPVQKSSNKLHLTILDMSFSFFGLMESYSWFSYIGTIWNKVMLAGPSSNYLTPSQPTELWAKRIHIWNNTDVLRWHITHWNCGYELLIQSTMCHSLYSSLIWSWVSGHWEAGRATLTEQHSGKKPLISSK